MIERDITVGKVVSTYGNRGMLKVLPLTDFPDRFLDMDRVTLEQNGKQRDFAVTGVKRHRKHILLRLGEIADMSAAETLKGALIKVGREELIPLPEDNYYIFDIVGLKVYSPEGDYIGVVEDVIQTGANDVYVVDTGDKKAPVLVPALKDVVREIDIKGGRMVVDYGCK
ncbi:MAG: ribosome maturation factor RimM [Bacillota bacterium]